MLGVYNCVSVCLSVCVCVCVQSKVIETVSVCILWVDKIWVLLKASQVKQVVCVGQLDLTVGNRVGVCSNYQ